MWFWLRTLPKAVGKLQTRAAIFPSGGSVSVLTWWLIEVLACLLDNLSYDLFISYWVSLEWHIQKQREKGRGKKESGDPKIETSVLINDSCFKVTCHSFFHIVPVAWTHSGILRQELHAESGPLGSSAAASLRQWRPILVPCNAQTIRPTARGSHRGWEVYFPKGQ